MTIIRTAGPDCVVYNSITTLTHTYSLIPPWEDLYEWHRITRMTAPACAVMCNLINTHTHTRTHTHTHTHYFRRAREKGAMAFVECLGFPQEDMMEGPL